MTENRRGNDANIMALLARVDERTLSTHTNIKEIKEKLEKHDGRIRAVEGNSKKWAGGAIVGAGVVGWISKHLSF